MKFNDLYAAAEPGRVLENGLLKNAGHEASCACGEITQWLHVDSPGKPAVCSEECLSVLTKKPEAPKKMDPRAYAQRRGLIWHAFTPGSTSNKVHCAACGTIGIIVPEWDWVTCPECRAILDKWELTYGKTPEMQHDA